ncbi:MAG: hypothetical protein ACI9P5_004766 [Saprospiraceae bacterium]
MLGKDLNSLVRFFFKKEMDAGSAKKPSRVCFFEASHTWASGKDSSNLIALFSRENIQKTSKNSEVK